MNPFDLWLLRCQLLVLYFASYDGNDSYADATLTDGSLANLYFAHGELRSPRIERTIQGPSRKARIHASRSAIRGLRKSMLCAQHVHIILVVQFLKG